MGRAADTGSFLSQNTLQNTRTDLAGIKFYRIADRSYEHSSSWSKYHAKYFCFDDDLFDGEHHDSDSACHLFSLPEKDVQAAPA